ncbi:cytochrome P450 [Anthocerotibacter panamensis]|uniref:cytochrome P450 n=1 Tax=Anthocerotibacter panamensis TaxID=2857077 RepID=UPI001C404F5A|nr:cytochrome P450 [Anthocerotibacter panamensis]
MVNFFSGSVDLSQEIFQLPGPHRSSLVGNLLDFGRDPLGFLSHCARTYGSIVPLRFGLTPVCLLNEPELVEHVLKNPQVFSKSRGLRSLHRLLGEGLLTSEGDIWLHQRKLMQPVFHQRRIHAYSHTMVAFAERMLAIWQEGETRDLHRDMMRLTLDLVMKTIFSWEVSDPEAQDVAHALAVAIHWFERRRNQNFVVWEWFLQPEDRRYREAIERMDERIYTILAERHRRPDDTGDLLSLLMEARDEADGSQLSDLQLRDEVATLMLAGHETTANTLCWAWLLLSQHLDAEERLIHELSEVLDDRPPTLADLPRLHYTDGVIKEALRLYPPVTILSRETSQDTEIGGYAVPKGCVLLLSQWTMHRDPRYFVDPELFRPERWGADLERQLPRGAYFPFGDGPRICIGKSFALMEALLILATIARQVHFTLVAPVTPEPSLTLRPAQGMKVRVNRR